MYWLCLLFIAAPTVLGIGWCIFRSWTGFFESIWYELIPDLISLLRGELKRDWIAEFKLGLFVIISLVTIAYEMKMLDWMLE